MSDLGIDARYGDAEDTEFIEGLNLASIKWIVVATHDKHVNQAISQSLKKAGYQGQLALTAHSAVSGEPCFYRGDELLIIPHEYAAERAAEYISQQSVLNNNERSSALNG